jgi:hypothetical protein
MTSEMNYGGNILDLAIEKAEREKGKRRAFTPLNTIMGEMPMPRKNIHSA